MQPPHLVPTPHLVPCDTCGKPARRVGVKLICAECETAERQAAADKFCAEHGLVTIEDKVAYCKKLSRTFGRGPTFEQWANRLTQSTVDMIERMDGSTSRTLERLRGAGVIDGRNKIIPPEARRVAAEAYAAERAHIIVERERESAEAQPPTA